MHNEKGGLITVTDPKGNNILIPESYLQKERDSYKGFIKETLTAPSYMIDIATVGIYFFKLINWQINFMVQTRWEGSSFVVDGCVENPTEDFVSNLLKMGSITSFV